jgi:hypothetical protein
MRHSRMIFIGAVLFLLAACSQTTTAPLSANANALTIFDDTLTSGWQDWSWETNYRYLDCDCPQSGNKAIQANFKAWGGLSLRNDTALNTSDYGGISFGVYSVKGNTRIKLMAYSDDTTVTGTAVIAATTGAWKDFTVSWSQLSNPSQIRRIAFQNNSEQNDSEILIDNLSLTAESGGNPSPEPAPSPEPTPTPNPTPPTPEPTPNPEPQPINDFTAEQWEGIRRGGINTAETDENMRQAAAIYGPSTGLSGATNPTPVDLTRNASSFDPWLQYISADNTPITVYSFLVRVRNNDGSLVFKTFNGQQMADLIAQGVGGAAYDFRNNRTEPLYTVVNGDGSVTVSKDRTDLFAHLFFGGQVGGAQGVVMAVKASGNGYMQVGIDFKTPNFDNFPGQDGNNGTYLYATNSSYQRVTGTPQWFGVSNANE